MRRDGGLRSDAPQPIEPGVVLAFEAFQWDGQSRNDQGQRLGRYVELTFECDTFLHWKDNVRAIALALEALRKVERYGIARARAAEVGRKLLGAAFAGSGMSRDAAREIIARFSGYPIDELFGPKVKDAYRDAMRATHTDTGGNQEDAATVNNAYDVLKAHLNID